MSEVINGNLQDVLGAIKSVQDKNVYPVYIPKLQRNVMFKELNTKQEKMLVKTIVDSPIYNSEFIFAMRSIIKENCAEDIDIDSLTIIDKTAICLVMRMKSIGDTFTFTFKGKNMSKDITISDYIDDFKDIVIPEDKEVGNDDIKIVCSYPTILTEYDLEMEFRSNVEELEIKNIEQARTAIGDVFSNEIIKYIKQITVVRDDTEMVLDMNDYSFKNRILILEEIGQTVTKEVLEYIEAANEILRGKLTIELELNESDKKKFESDTLSGMLEAGSDFFIIS